MFFKIDFIYDLFFILKFRHRLYFSEQFSVQGQIEQKVQRFPTCPIKSLYPHPSFSFFKSPLFYFFLIYFFFFSHPLSIWKFLGQESNPSWSCDLCHSCSNTASSTSTATSWIINGATEGAPTPLSQEISVEQMLVKRDWMNEWRKEGRNCRLRDSQFFAICCLIIFLPLFFPPKSQTLNFLESWEGFFSFLFFSTTATCRSSRAPDQTHGRDPRRSGCNARSLTLQATRELLRARTSRWEPLLGGLFWIPSTWFTLSCRQSSGFSFVYENDVASPVTAREVN